MRIRPVRATTAPVTIPAPTAGLINTHDLLGSLEVPDNSAILLYNFIPGRSGCRVRPGSTEFATGVLDKDSAEGEIRSLLAYNSNTSGSEELFAVTNDGVYDITAGGEGPHTRVLEWPTKTGDAGYCSSHNFTNVAGDQYLLVCDEVNGYYIYNGSSWAVGTFTGSTTPDAGDLVDVVEWQGRIWFVEKGTASAWYLDPLNITGDITEFNVGSRFKRGGSLRQISTWTSDGGEGIDDKLVMISSSGDVLVFEGTDPSIYSEISMRGRWEVGPPPAGRRVLHPFAGDLLILSSAGVLPVSALAMGTSKIDYSAFLSSNISSLFHTEMDALSTSQGWGFVEVPDENLLLITLPMTGATTRAHSQLAISLPDRGWSVIRDLDMLCGVTNTDRTYFGTRDGRVLTVGGEQDNISLAGDDPDAITFSLLMQYTNLESSMLWKTPKFARPTWISDLPPSVNIKILKDFNVTELATNPVFAPISASLWDTAIWDTSVWAGSASGQIATSGAGGFGRYLAVAIRGETKTATTYLGTDVLVEQGGVL